MANLDSLSSILADLEAQAAVHQRQAQHHAEQEEAHRERRSFHAAELARISQCLTALRGAAVEARTLAARPLPADSIEAMEDFGPRSQPKVTAMVGRVVADKTAGSRFGVREVTQAVNRRFAQHLESPVREKQVSIVLSRMAGSGRIHQVRKGRPYQEAIFTLGRPG